MGVRENKGKKFFCFRRERRQKKIYMLYISSFLSFFFAFGVKAKKKKTSNSNGNQKKRPSTS